METVAFVLPFIAEVLALPLFCWGAGVIGLILGTSVFLIEILKTPNSTTFSRKVKKDSDY